MNLRLLIVEDDPNVRSTLATFLEMEGFLVETASSTASALAKLEQGAFPLVLSDIYIDQRTGLDVLEAATRADPRAAVILMTGRGSMETVMAATRGGAFEYLAKPFELETLLAVLRRAAASLTEAAEPDDPEDDLPSSELIGSSPAMVDIYKTISHVAPTDVTVLIEGETGTGKEMIARMIHNHSRRSQYPFVPVDCGAIPASLLESELFGALKGSYTGADRDRTGVLESANKGTVFLDEIGDIDAGFQLRLLRFLQEREVRPLGAAKGRPVDVRVVAATNRNIRKLVEEQKFREDLWFRLNVLPIRLPPLRERRGDIPLLAHFFLKRYNERYQLNARFEPAALRALEEHTWPGNVRQLQHLVERLVILTPLGRIDEASVARALEETRPGQSSSGDSLADLEAEQIRKVMAATGNNKSRAARILGIERKTLYRKLEKMGLT